MKLRLRAASQEKRPLPLRFKKKRDIKSPKKTSRRLGSRIVLVVAGVVVCHFMLTTLYLGNVAHSHPSLQLNAPRKDNVPGIMSTKDLQVQPEDLAAKLFSWLENDERGPRRKPLTAYLEPPSMNSTSQPLPLRTQTPSQLKRVVYPRVISCEDIPSKLPVDRGAPHDADGKPIVTNVGEQITPPDFLEQQTPHCPVDEDPYLPWIHDVFLDAKGNVQFIAQNKRRCQTGPKHVDDLKRLEPQVALLQSVSVQRLSADQAEELAPDLWKNEGSSSDSNTRYRLAPHNEADSDGMHTRFICRFHTWDIEAPDNRLELGETLSEYPLDYELTAFRNTYL